MAVLAPERLPLTTLSTVLAFQRVGEGPTNGRLLQVSKMVTPRFLLVWRERFYGHDVLDFAHGHSFCFGAAAGSVSDSKGPAEATTHENSVAEFSSLIILGYPDGSFRALVHGAKPRRGVNREIKVESGRSFVRMTGCRKDRGKVDSTGCIPKVKPSWRPLPKCITGTYQDIVGSVGQCNCALRLSPEGALLAI